MPRTGRPQHHPVTLTKPERDKLVQLIRRGTASARVIRRANTLLLTDKGHDDRSIAKALHSARNTIRRTRERYATGGLDAALQERPRVGKSPKLNNKQQAMLIAIACSDAPDGKATWTMQLLADRLIELGVVTGISGETVRRTLKKTRSSRDRRGTGASPG